MNKEGQSPYSLLPLLFLFFVRVYRPPPFFSFFFFYSIALSLHGPLWASSNGPLWAWCIGRSLLFFGITPIIIYPLFSYKLKNLGAIKTLFSF